MLVTKQWIESNYNKYNALYFGNVLPQITFKIGRSKKTWGLASWRYSRKLEKLIRESITISNYYDSPEDVKLTTLLHEMIHIYDYTVCPEHFIQNGKKVRGYDAHGSWFKTECRRLSKYGWNIEKYVTAEEKACSSLSGRTLELEQNKIDQALVCVVRGKNGYAFMIKTSKYYAKKVKRTVEINDFSSALGEVKSIKFYKFNNPALAKRRSCGSTLRGWKYDTMKLQNRLNEIHATEVRIAA